MNRRILLLITDLEIGGTPTVVRELAIRLNAPPNVQVEVACLSTWGPVADQLREAGIIVTALGAKSPRDIRVIPRLIHLIRQRRFDTVFSFLIHANAVAAVAKVFTRDVRFIQSIQTTQPRPRWHWKLQAIVHEAAEKVIVPSKSVAIAAQEWAAIPPGKIEVISNAINIEDFCNTGFQPVSHGLKTRVTKNIGFIGRLDPIKRLPDLLAAISLLDQEFHLHIFGDGSERKNLESEVSRLALLGRVTMHGAVANPRKALAIIDVLVLPSQAEGFGLVLIEAMAAGVPVVATDVPGIRDVVRHEQTGLLVPVGEPNALALAIRRISEDHLLREKLIAAALKDVQERFSWPVVLRHYRQVLRLDQA